MLFFSKNDPTDPRVGDFAQNFDLLSQASMIADDTENLILIGYPDDEGIRINGGRVGAALAPDVVRKYFYKMTPTDLFRGSLDRKPSQLRVLDAGNIPSDEISNLKSRHELAQNCISEALSKGAKSKSKTLSIGGGHDYGFPDGMAYLEWCRVQNIRPLIINIDAHLDVRPTTSGLSSGTPFYRLFESGIEFDFAEIGIQSQCNSKTHLEYVEARGGKVLFQDEAQLAGESFQTFCEKRLAPWLEKRRTCFLSIDIDAFSSAFAPGCSQSWASGLTPEQFWPFYYSLLNRLDIPLVGIYEVSPPLDQDDRTAKLAAELIHHLAFRC